MQMPCVLLSGGLDSYTAAAIVKSEGFSLDALTVHYGQRHARELESARPSPAGSASSDTSSCRSIFARIGGSSLTSDASVPRDRDLAATDIPSTYVPARNTIFLSLALGWAEVLEARDIVIGVNALDYSGYPDCRPEFIAAFESLASLATRAGVEGARFRVHTPLHRDDQGRDHPRRRRARARLRSDDQLLRSRAPTDSRAGTATAASCGPGGSPKPASPIRCWRGPNGSL